MDYSLEVEELCSENYDLRSEKDHIKQAQDMGREIISNDDQTLTFDLDSEEALSTFKGRVGILGRKGFSPSWVISKSKSGNYHAVVKLNNSIVKIDESIRLVIQACLGSDWKREFLGVLRILNRQPQVSMLFRPQPLEIVAVSDPDPIESL